MSYQTQQFELLGISGEYARQRIPLGATALVIGKDSRKANLILSDNTVSRTHCQFSIRQGQVYLEDLDSSNGTFVNDARIQPRRAVALRDGDLVALAGSAIFRIVALHAEAPAPDTIARQQISPPSPRFEKQPVVMPQATSNAFDMQKFARILLMIGGGITLIAIIWWGLFYGTLINEFKNPDDMLLRQIGQELNIGLGNALNCLYSNSGVCQLIIGGAQFVGKLPYNPIIFWVGIVLSAIGGILWLALRKPS